MWTSSLTGPGFVDLQVNGYGGTDFASPQLTPATARTACDSVLSGGTAAFLPTLVSAPIDVYRRNLDILGRLSESPEFGGRILGIHLEGPFLTADPRVLGAHRLENVRPCDPALLASMQEWSHGHLRVLTLSAEIEGAEELARAAKALGMIVAIGHSFADSGMLQRLADAGASILTHFGNGIPQMLPRHDNPVLAGLATEGMKATIILDGHHVSEVFARVAQRAFGPDGLILVSDASPLQGLQPGNYRVFDQEVVLDAAGRVMNVVEQHLCGSTRSLMECVNVALEWKLLDAAGAIRSAFDLPLALIDAMPGAWQATSRVRFDPAAGRFELG
jgi:N-acetylglucosamine-6-phosphate deacetylase